MSDYTARKISHLKRLGLVSASSTGVGMHGGAAPDWLIADQKARKAAREKAAEREWARRSAFGK